MGEDVGEREGEGVRVWVALIIIHQQEFESYTDGQSNSRFNDKFPFDPTLDASNLGFQIRLRQSEIGRDFSLDANIYMYVCVFF